MPQEIPPQVLPTVAGFAALKICRMYAISQRQPDQFANRSARASASE